MNACGYKIFVFPNIHTSNKLKSNTPQETTKNVYLKLIVII